MAFLSWLHQSLLNGGLDVGLAPQAPEGLAVHFGHHRVGAAAEACAEGGGAQGAQSPGLKKNEPLVATNRINEYYPTSLISINTVYHSTINENQLLELLISNYYPMICAHSSHSFLPRSRRFLHKGFISLCPFRTGFNSACRLVIWPCCRKPIHDHIGRSFHTFPTLGRVLDGPAWG